MLTALTLLPTLAITPDRFYELCQCDRDLRLELTAPGELILMPPTAWESGNRNARLPQRLGN